MLKPAQQAGQVISGEFMLPRSAAAQRWSARGLREGLALEQGGRVDAAGALRAARAQIREPSNQLSLISTA